MRIGVYFSANKSNGGVYQYGLAFLEALQKIKGAEFVIFNDSADSLDEFANYFTIINFKKAGRDSGGSILKKIFKRALRISYRVILELHLDFAIKKLSRLALRRELALIKEQKVDLIIFLSQNYVANFLSIPVINIVYDLQHRLNPQFPEVSRKGVGQMREYFYQRLVENSTRILVDSEVGKQDLMRFYNFPAAKIIILPFLPPNYLMENMTKEEAVQILSPHQLPKNFLFYPGQFWPHKNHLNILKAINKLKDSGLIINVVFCGVKRADWGIYEQLKKYAFEHSLNDQIFYLDYVDHKTISALYRQAQALIMPTFFGPTNIPVLEAWKMNCPVIYSNISGCREQLGEAGLLVDPSDFSDIADKIALIWENELLRKDLIIKGRERLARWTYLDFATKIEDMINQLSV